MEAEVSWNSCVEEKHEIYLSISGKFSLRRSIKSNHSIKMPSMYPTGMMVPMKTHWSCTKSLLLKWGMLLAVVGMANGILLSRFCCWVGCTPISMQNIEWYSKSVTAYVTYYLVVHPGEQGRGILYNQSMRTHSLGCLSDKVQLTWSMAPWDMVSFGVLKDKIPLRTELTDITKSEVRGSSACGMNTIRYLKTSQS